VGTWALPGWEENEDSVGREFVDGDLSYLGGGWSISTKTQSVSPGTVIYNFQRLIN